MPMGTRKQHERQEPLWYRSELAEAPGDPFYQRLNRVLDQEGFDRFCEDWCREFYHVKLGRLSLAPGTYFRLMIIGLLEGLDSERGIAWRVADSLTLRQFLHIGLDERTPDHVTISRTRRLIGAEAWQPVVGERVRLELSLQVNFELVKAKSLSVRARVANVTDMPDGPQRLELYFRKPGFKDSGIIEVPVKTADNGWEM
jgi:transposase